ncbi:Crp/Fnr family transcriptional regulator [Alloiococcus sp. CFN-8]|uniref:Crp/Fnr family transcriptional regulator n=1 Tax=Alloiococcus sp. CFN-8 TaxID=3416081 RepID=UPI003CEBE701
MDVNYSYITVLKKCKLFINFTEAEIINLLSSKNIPIKSYPLGEIIFTQGNECHFLSIVLEGEVEIQKLEASGKVLTVSRLNSGDVFGENLLFGDKNHYPMNVVSKKTSKILHIPKASVAALSQNHGAFMTSFMQTLSNKAVALSSKLNEIGLRSLRQKICDYIYSEYKKTASTRINLSLSKKEWAEHLGVQRPSLSRELMKLKEEGIIEYDKTSITILDEEAIEDILEG